MTSLQQTARVLSLILITGTVLFNSFLFAAETAKTSAKATELNREVNVLAQELRQLAQNGDNSPGRALGELVLEQLIISQNSYSYKKIQPQELLSRLRLAVESAKTAVHPLAGKSGNLEAAYICDTDNSAQPYRLYIPQTNSSQPLPLIVLLHGYVPSYNKLDWVDITPAMEQCFSQLGAALLLPFGRSNTDFQSIGEVDVMRAISEVMTLFPLDPERIILAGYSMGGSGVWSILAHYPDFFSAALIWSGRNDYFYWHADKIAQAGLSRNTYPQWKRYLIEVDNPIDYYPTLRHIPVTAIHPADDMLVKPGHGDNMLRRLGPPAGQMQLIKVPRGQGGHFYFQNQLDNAEIYQPLLKYRQQKAKDVTAIEHVVYTPKYGKKYWLAVTQIENWGQPAYIKCQIERDNNILSLTQADNVKEICIDLQLAELSEQVTLELPIGFVRQIHQDVSLLRIYRAPTAISATNISPATKKTDLDTVFTTAKYPRMAQSLPQYGSVKEAFNQPFILVVPTLSEDSAVFTANLEAAKRFMREWYVFAQGIPKIIIDKDVTADIEAQYNLLCFGDQECHAILKKYAGQLPFSKTVAGYQVGDITVQPETDEKLGIVAVYPNPENSGRVIVMFDGLYYGSSLSSNHKWDLVPDYIIYSEQIDAVDSTNSAILAGFFDSNWQFRRELATSTLLLNQ